MESEVRQWNPLGVGSQGKFPTETKKPKRWERAIRWAGHRHPPPRGLGPEAWEAGPSPNLTLTPAPRAERLQPMRCSISGLLRKKAFRLGSLNAS